MSQVLNLLYVFFNGDFFVVIIAALMLILTVVLIGLVKIQRENDRLIEANNALKNDVVSEIKIEDEEKEETLLDSNVEKMVIESNLDETLNNDLDEKVEEKEEGIIKIDEVEDINPIEQYEMDEEANAVISTKELENIEKERNELYGTENNAKLIEEYEEEQESKAIISYSELLKNAKGLELNYIEKPKEDENAPLVKQVEIKEEPLKGVSYKAEEEYLKILKEFRNELMLNG